jgi:hypothetical protein
MSLGKGREPVELGTPEYVPLASHSLVLRTRREVREELERLKGRRSLLPRGHWEIYVTDIVERKPRKLVTGVSDVIRPSWSRDGKWIYFRSEKPGWFGIYRSPSSGGDAVLLSKDIDGWNPQESFDGKTV